MKLFSSWCSSFESGIVTRSGVSFFLSNSFLLSFILNIKNLYINVYVSPFVCCGSLFGSYHRRRLRGGLGARATPGKCYGGAEPPLRNVQKFALYRFLA